MAVTDHDTTAAVDEVQALRRGARHRGDSGHRDHRRRRRPRRARARLLPRSGGSRRSGVPRRRSARHASTRVRAIAARLAELGHADRRRARCSRRRATAGARSIGRPQVARAMVAPVMSPTRAKRSTGGWAATARLRRRGPGRRPKTVIGDHSRAGGLASLAHPGRTRDRRADPGAARRRSRCARGLSLRSRRAALSSAIARMAASSGC